LDVTLKRAAPFASLYPPYTWIPAFAGMTEEGVRPYVAVLLRCSGTLPGELGVSPDFLTISQGQG